MASLNEGDNRELLNQILIELRKQNELLSSTTGSDDIKHKQFYNIETAATILSTSVDSLQYHTRPDYVEVPFSWFGREKRFSNYDLDRWYRTRRVPTMLEIRAEILAKKNGKK